MRRKGGALFDSIPLTSTTHREHEQNPGPAAGVLAFRGAKERARPRVLAAKGRGSSAMALAVRTLQSCRPVETPLARAAAESAAAALRVS